MSDHLSNTDTALAGENEQEKGIPSTPYQNEDVDVLPPRTGYLRVNYYKRTPGQRQYPSSCAAGLAMLGVTLWPLGLILCEARSVTSPAVLGGTLFFASGLVQIITGIWAIVDNNLFGSVVLLCLGAFFMSFGSFAVDLFGVNSAYTDPLQVANAEGIFLSTWVAFTFIIWISTFKSTWPLFLFTFFLWLFFLLFDIAVFGSHQGCKIASGVFAFLTSMCAFYAMYDGLSENTNSYAPVPSAKILRMPGAYHVPAEDRVQIV
ncbi:unnamed protein product [Ambrosiozyma monospora]|uniref:Unnamed protein product n=1 Tax=Ambrosiozyma monospora TaxID=43982 RepID=A0ACB5TX48_AMBMO|nr:unnamed protein product [Ambrosiozyma monospora]